MTMKKLAAVFCISASLFFSPAGTMAAGEQKRGVIKGGVAHAAPDWFKESFLDIREDVDEATEANRHVLLFFQLNGCPYCDRMLREAFETDPLMSYIQQHFDVIAINVRGDREIAFNEDTSVSEKELSELLKVRSTPGIMFLNADNKPVVRVDGYRAPERFKLVGEQQARLADHPELRPEELPPWAQRFAAGPFLKMSPARDRGDAFFAARLRRWG